MVTSPTPDPDGLYEKYRVFKEPEYDDARNPVESHPVELTAFFSSPGIDLAGEEYDVMTQVEEVKSFVFVLKPDTDPHARVAISAYAWSIKDEKPHLFEDLMLVLGEWS